MTSPAPDPLLRHADWLRRLALDLVRDPHAADDVVQDAFVVALRRSPREGLDGPSVRAWLGAVVRNLAHMRTRGEVRRQRRERAAAAVAAETADSAARVHAHRMLLDEVERLEPRDRDVVVLRYLDGLPPREIARRLGLTSVAVRSRLSRALARLRARLAGERGSLAALLPILGPRVPWRILSWIGGVTMKKTLATTAVCLAALVLVLVRPGSQVEPTAERLAPPPAALAAGGAAATTTPSAPLPPEMRVPVSEPQPAPPAPRSGAVLVVLARCVDAAGAPIPGAHVCAAEVAGRPGVETGPDGRARLELAWPPQLTSGNAHWIVVEATAPSRSRVQRQEAVQDPSAPVQVGDLVLVAGGALAGAVRDESGEAAADAHVMLVAAATAGGAALEEERAVYGRGFAGLGPGAVFWGRTDAAGAYHFTGVPAGLVSVVVRRRGSYCGYTAPVEVVAGGEAHAPDVVLRAVAPHHLVSGRVLDEHGDALSGASVEAHGNRARRNVDPVARTRTERDGSFALALATGRSYTLVVEHSSVRERSLVRHDVDAGSTGVVLQLVPPRTMRVLVENAGEPVDDVVVRLTDPHGMLLPVRTRLAASGGVEVPLPSEEFRLGVAAKGHRERWEGPFDPQTAPERITIALVRAAALRGRVVLHGEPVAGAHVHVHLRADGGHARLSGGLLTRYEAAAGETRTDAAGRFELYPHSPSGTTSELLVHAEVEGLIRAESEPVRWDGTSSREGLELRLVEPAALAGRVLVAPGVSASGLLIGATRGDGHVALQITGDGGTFRFEGLTPGGWQVRRCEPADQQWLRAARTWPAPDARELPVDIHLHAGATAHLDLDLRHEVPALVRGTLRIDGAPAAGWRATIWLDEHFVTSRTDGEGSFVLAMRRPARVVLHLSGALDRGSLRLRRALVAEAGENVVTCNVRTGTLELAELPPSVPADSRAGGEARGYALTWTDAAESGTVFLFDPDAAGTCTARAVPTGRVQIRRRGEGTSDDPASWQILGEAAIEPGRTARWRAEPSRGK